MFIAAYNTLGSIFRGLGDARTPLLAVAIACAANIVLDLLLVAGFKMGAAGAAMATVMAQAISVILSLAVVARQGLPFPFSWRHIRFHGSTIKEIVKLGAPVALQDLLVSISFLAITAIVNQLGVIASAGVGVAEKVCTFILLVPSAYAQSISTYVRSEYRRESTPTGKARHGLRHCDIAVIRHLHELFRILSRSSAFRLVLTGRAVHLCCGRLSESLCNRYAAGIVYVLLCRVLQRLRQDDLRDVSGTDRRFLCADSGFLPSQQMRTSYTVSDRSGNAVFDLCADHPLRSLFLCLKPKRKEKCLTGFGPIK